jgi:hypothetical protein
LSAVGNRFRFVLGLSSAGQRQYCPDYQ